MCLPQKTVRELKLSNTRSQSSLCMGFPLIWFLGFSHSTHLPNTSLHFTLVKRDQINWDWLLPLIKVNVYFSKLAEERKEQQEATEHIDEANDRFNELASEETLKEQKYNKLHQPFSRGGQTCSPNSIILGWHYLPTIYKCLYCLWFSEEECCNYLGIELIC